MDFYYEMRKTLTNILSSCFNGTYDDSKTNNTGGNDPLCYSFLKVVHLTCCCGRIKHLLVPAAGLMMYVCYGIEYDMCSVTHQFFFIEINLGGNIAWIQ